MNHTCNDNMCGQERNLLCYSALQIKIEVKQKSTSNQEPLVVSKAPLGQSLTQFLKGFTGLLATGALAITKRRMWKLVVGVDSSGALLDSLDAATPHGNFDGVERWRNHEPIFLIMGKIPQLTPQNDRHEEEIRDLRSYAEWLPSGVQAAWPMPWRRCASFHHRQPPSMSTKVSLLVDLCLNISRQILW